MKERRMMRVIEEIRVKEVRIMWGVRVILIRVYWLEGGNKTKRNNGNDMNYF